MIKVSLLVLEQSTLTGITAVMDIFRMAGVTWDETTGIEMNPLFQVELVSLDGKPVRYSGAVEITPDKSVADVHATDLIIVPSSGYKAEDIGYYSTTLAGWLRQHNTNGAEVAGICTGVFLLAEAGLLNNKMATTHWGYASLFRKKYPRVNLRPERLITYDENIYCSGGGSAGIDLCLFLIEKYYGVETANHCARVLLLERGREIQTPYETFRFKKKHQDQQILKAQVWIESSVGDPLAIDDVAAHVGMSARNFKRRFKMATGDTPVVYIQKLRVEAAKRYLEFETKRVEAIASAVGYDDVGFFRKLFVRYTGISPTAYRQKYNQELKTRLMAISA